MDQIGTRRTWLAILLPPSFMRRCVIRPIHQTWLPHPKWWGKRAYLFISTSVFADKPIYSDGIGREAEIRHGSRCRVLVTQYRRDIYWLTAVLQHYASPCIQTGKKPLRCDALHVHLQHSTWLLTQQLFQRQRCQDRNILSHRGWNSYFSESDHCSEKAFIIYCGSATIWQSWTLFISPCSGSLIQFEKLQPP